MVWGEGGERDGSEVNHEYSRWEVTTFRVPGTVVEMGAGGLEAR